jgi:hypothetical protein
MRRLITGHPRSGTQYMAILLSYHGITIPHEKTKHDCGEGIVSYEEIKEPTKYDIILHQVRCPLKTIASSTKLLWSTVLSMWRIMNKSPYKKDPNTINNDKYFRKNNLFCLMWTWLNFNRHIENYTDWRFRIEDIDKIYHKLCKKLELKPFSKIPDIPRNTNHRKHIDLTWRDLEKIDHNLCKQIKELACEYGYDIH